MEEGKKRKRGKLFCKPGDRRKGCKTKSKRWQKAFNRMYD